MTEQEKIDQLKITSGESNEVTISIYLSRARAKILAITGWNEIPQEYDQFHIEAAEYLLNKRGAEGELYHNENGINRSYESANLPTSMLLSYGIFGRAEVIS